MLVQRRHQELIGGWVLFGVETPAHNGTPAFCTLDGTHTYM